MRNSQPESPVSSIGERLSGADPRASITQLFESMRPDLLRFAHWLARDRSLAEDIVQESLLRAWRSLVSLDEALESHATAKPADPEGDLFTLRNAIMRLPIEYREPLLLQVLGGFSTDEIARELALSSTAVLTRLFRARNKLRASCGMSPAPDVSTSEAAP
jgi:RNA polymerase sigma-70 factor, ECF subfamily